MSLPKFVTLVEVGPRDGLQNEPMFVPTPIKVQFINLLSQTGLQHIEVTSFVSPQKIPQLADAEEVYRLIDKPKALHFSALVPNEKGMATALSAGVQEISVFTGATQSFTKHNIHCSIEESLDRFEPVIAEAKRHKIRVRAYISCVLGCPYEGNVESEAVAAIAHKLYKLGCDALCLGDTIGVGTPQKTKNLIHTVSQKIPLHKISMHFHDTYGQAIANIYAALELGIDTFDSSVAGLGGCPYAKGASGNVATEDVLYLLNGLEIATNVDIFKVIEVGQFISKQLQRKNQSKVAQALGGM